MNKDMKTISIEDIEFEDAVIRIPKNAVTVTIEVQTYENGEMQTVSAKLCPSEIREAFRTFEETMSGDYPLYALTENGRHFIEEKVE